MIRDLELEDKRPRIRGKDTQNQRKRDLELEEKIPRIRGQQRIHTKKIEIEKEREWHGNIQVINEYSHK